MFTTNVFDYTNILDKAADASWMRENVITNNIANIDTPGYKRQDVDFESVLQKALGKTKYSSLDKKVRELNQDLGKLTTTSYTDAANYSYRLDRNNVDENTENAELASESLRYQLLTTAITNNFSRMQTVHHIGERSLHLQKRQKHLFHSIMRLQERERLEMA